MNQVYQSAFLKALGWSLIDSLWQMGLLWLLYVVLTANGKRYQSHQRHTIALLSLAGGSLWFLVSLVMNFYEAAAAPVVYNWYQGAAAPVIDHGFFGNLSRNIESALPFLSIGYLLAAAWLFIRFYYRYNYTRRLLKADMMKAAPELRVFLQQAAGRMGINKKVALWLSAAAEAPMTLGFWKPVILLPISIVNHLSIQQTEAILLHELKHIKRNDYLINILMACVDVVLFFNPFAQWISAAIRRERENSCDDLVLQFRYDPAQYATSLLVLEQQRSATQQTLAVAATGSKTPALLHRVKRILHQEQVCTPVSHRMVAYLLTALLFGFVGLYNPGNVIVKKIYPVVFSTDATPQFASYEPAPEEKETPGKVVTTKKQKKNYTSVQPAATPGPLPSIHILTASEAEELLRLAAGIEIAGMMERKLAEQQRLIEEHQRQLAAQQHQVQFQIRITAVSNQASLDARDFTLANQATVLCEPANSAEIKPYVPRNSFAYQYMQDSCTPKIYTEANRLQAEAREAITRAMTALNEVDLTRLESELKAKGIELHANQIRQELHKAFMEITMKRLCEGALNSAEDVRAMYAKAQAEWQKKLENFQRDRAKKRAEQDALRRKIVEERLMENAKPELKKAINNKSVDI
ncbi:M56 family metallopeptidase [Pseudoflavitalea rhizosphaerae]|uniref:M56 family metallopeptidase n=1 Tax=Pseudoflavitalea rhizosphaerae TaxID=1884793 RepID=UPI000F8D2617|nr:M56 family metallopeptidase [Pseudoflavitalea rhizosphaerae]